MIEYLLSTLANAKARQRMQNGYGREAAASANGGILNAAGMLQQRIDTQQELLRRKEEARRELERRRAELENKVRHQREQERLARQQEENRRSRDLDSGLLDYEKMRAKQAGDIRKHGLDSLQRSRSNIATNRGIDINEGKLRLNRDRAQHGFDQDEQSRRRSELAEGRNRILDIAKAYGMNGRDIDSSAALLSNMASAKGLDINEEVIRSAIKQGRHSSTIDKLREQKLRRSGRASKGRSSGSSKGGGKSLDRIAQRRVHGYSSTLDTAQRAMDAISDLADNSSFIDTGPFDDIAQRVASWTGYTDEDWIKVDSYLSMVMKNLATALEQGRLTDHDMAYYKKFLPSTNDHPEQIKKKLGIFMDKVQKDIDIYTGNLSGDEDGAIDEKTEDNPLKSLSDDELLDTLRVSLSRKFGKGDSIDKAREAARILIGDKERGEEILMHFWPQYAEQVMDSEW